MTSTRNNNVLMYNLFMDAFSERVHDADMKGQAQTTERLGYTRLEDVGHGG
ncbi:MAG: hypothetical protein ABIF19_14790 [Planctomycetota bacterium]